MELLGDSLSRISNSNAEKIFLVGDFNLPDFDWINQLPLSLDQLYVNSFEIFNDAFLTQVRLPHKWRAQSIYRQHLLRLEIYIFWRSKGSIIGPILFIIYINDIGSDLSPETLLPLYADDAKYSRVIRGQLDRDILQQDISTLYRWSEAWWSLTLRNVNISASRTKERHWKPHTALEPSVSHCHQKKKT